MHRLLALVPFLLFACAPPSGAQRPAEGCPSTLVDIDGTCVYSDILVAMLLHGLDTDAPEGLVQVSARPFAPSAPTTGASSALGHVWVTPLPAPGTPLTADDVYRSVGQAPGRLPTPFPLGTVVVQASADRAGPHAVHVKVGQQGTDDDWRHTVWTDGVPAEADPSCQACHSLGARPESEGLFGLPAAAR